MGSLKVLVVDDSLVYRKFVSDLLSQLDHVVVVGSASNGRIALARVEELKPDLVTLDIEMPEMDGLTLLRELRARQVEVGVLMVSSHTIRGGELTIQALELGAFDFVTKPKEGDLASNRESLLATLNTILKAFASRQQVQGMLRAVGRRGSSPLQSAPEDVRKAKSFHHATTFPSLDQYGQAKANLVLIGVSTGGPNALARVIPAIPPKLPAPIVIAQHMPATFTRSLASRLNDKSPLAVKEAADGEELKDGWVYIAPGGRQTRLEAFAGRRIVRITDGPPGRNCKPSIDDLFRSAALMPTGPVTAVVMTGMGRDGTLGARLVKRAGGYILAQDKSTSVVFGMPKGVIEAGVADKICPLDGIASEICRTVWGLGQ